MWGTVWVFNHDSSDKVYHCWNFLLYPGRPSSKLLSHTKEPRILNSSLAVSLQLPPHPANPIQPFHPPLLPPLQTSTLTVCCVADPRAATLVLLYCRIYKSQLSIVKTTTSGNLKINIGEDINIKTFHFPASQQTSWLTCKLLVVAILVKLVSCLVLLLDCL